MVRPLLYARPRRSCPLVGPVDSGDTDLGSWGVEGGDRSGSPADSVLQGGMAAAEYEKVMYLLSSLITQNVRVHNGNRGNEILWHSNWHR
ncbi:unnamed protein product [Urochloa humidicola]